MITLQTAEEYLKIVDINKCVGINEHVNLRTKREMRREKILKMGDVTRDFSSYSYYITTNNGGDPIGINNAKDLMMILK